MHLSIGEVYAFSVFKNPLVERFGAGLTPIAIIFSISIVMLGLSAAVFGTWVERAGPRAAMFTAALCWSSGFFISALGVATTQLWLVYLGYGVIGGIGLGIGYISPVSTLIKWFPDRPGLATGLAIMGFGGGALIASPLSDRLLTAYASNPVDAIVPSFLTLGVMYLISMMIGAFVVRLPAEGWQPGRLDATHRGGDRRPPDHRRRVGEQRDPYAAVLAALDGALLQRYGGDRAAGAGLAHDPGFLRRLRPPRRPGSSGCCHWRTWPDG